jgi:hypothetical protein
VKDEIGRAEMKEYRNILLAIFSPAAEEYCIKSITVAYHNCVQFRTSRQKPVTNFLSGP